MRNTSGQTKTFIHLSALSCTIMLMET